MGELLGTEVDRSYLKQAKKIHLNNTAAELMQLASVYNEGILTVDGSFSVDTGKHTGRSPKDKHIIADEATLDNVWWENNAKIERDKFNLLENDMLDHMNGKNLFIQDLYAGTDPKEKIKVRIITEFAWQALFIQHLLILPARSEQEEFKEDLLIIDLPSFTTTPEKYGVRTETTIACDFTNNKILIAGTYYAGEIKKSVFTYFNYTLPPKGIFPMHCSANSDYRWKNTAIFFGLSGTGKTTLSADPDRLLIGDDEHGWTTKGVFNFEDGSYAKAINLSKEAEPQIYNAVRRFTTVLENVIVDQETRELNFNDDSLTENTRAAFPMSFVGDNVSKDGMADIPTTIIMLTCDAFGVMPPISKLNSKQAVYHFLSGYTAKVAGTEAGVTEPQTTFSACFGAPFMPLHPTKYAEMLGEKMDESGANVWLINTGWSGGEYGTGDRISLKYTRAMITSILNGELDNADFITHEVFGLNMPTSCPNVPSEILSPKNTWADKNAYDSKANELANTFNKNFAQFADNANAEILEAAPKATIKH